MSISFEIAPVAFEQVEADWLPGLKPYHYQEQVYQFVHEALSIGKTLGLFLVTPTGSGKTLASYAYAIKQQLSVIGVYPTNELMRDQYRALKPWLAPHQAHQLLQIDSRQLDMWQQALNKHSHVETLEILANWQASLLSTILTNPDILFYIFFGLYGSSDSKKKSDKPDFFAGIAERLFRLVMDCPIFVFDEFHLYNIKQMADVVFLASTLAAINPHKGRVFIFASATPDLVARQWLEERLMVDVEVVKAESSNSPTARTIAHPLQLTLLGADLKRWQGLEALQSYLPALQDFVATYPQARLVTIFDAVAGAMNVTQLFQQTLPQKSVGEVHGFSSETEREHALRQEITVGTSTIEVGIDFKDDTGKDMLLYEARTASQFIQRFGRLARHGKSLDIPNRAIAIVPEYVYNFFKTRNLAGVTVTRENLTNLVEAAFEIPQDFSRYITKYAPVEFHRAICFIEKMFQLDDRTEIIERVKNAQTALTGASAGRAYHLYREHTESKTIHPLLTFRNSNFQAGIIDERGLDRGFPIKRYNLMFLLRRGEFIELEESDYMTRLDELTACWPEDVMREKRYCKRIGGKPYDLLGVYGYFSLTGMLDKGRQVYFTIDQEEFVGKLGCITTLSGLEIEAEPPLRLRRLNRHLAKKEIVAWVIKKHPAYIQFGRGLPPLFEVFPLRIRKWNTLSDYYTIIFNQNAFFVDSLGGWQAEQREDNALIF